MANFYVFLWKFLSSTINFFYKLQEEYKHLQASSSNSSAPNSSSSTSTQPGNGGGMVPPMTSEAEILHEAKMLREHKDRLEGR